MRLKPILKKKPTNNAVVIEPVGNTPKKKEPPKKEQVKKTLPPDEYKPMFEPIRILVREMTSQKDKTKKVKQYIELSVKRFDDDEALPFVWVNMYQESDFYTGYLKGKTAHLPLDMLYDLIEGLQELGDECDKRNIRY